MNNKKPIGEKYKMKSFRTIKKNAKALSPVVASIILIAVTVAVSVVVAAWMGGMSVGLMGSAEQVSITNMFFPSTTTATVALSNAGSGVTINAAYVNGSPVTVVNATSTIYPKGASVISISGIPAMTSGDTIQLKLTTGKGNSLAYTQVVP
jgi:archaeal type IV pilus assembly protein PilA